MTDINLSNNTITNIAGSSKFSTSSASTATEPETDKLNLLQMGSIEEEFEKAAKYILELPKQGTYKPTTESKLMFYALYKQATEGPLPSSRSKPMKILFDARAKWEAWHQLGKLSKMDAMEKYVEEYKKVRKAYEKSSAAQES